MEENPYKAPDDNASDADKPKSAWSQPVPWISFSVATVCFVVTRVVLAYAAPKLPSNTSIAVAAAVGVGIAATTCKDWPRGK